MTLRKSNQKETKIISQFSDLWRGVNKKHFGKEINEWKKEEFFYYIEDGEKAVGYIFFKVEMGVGYIQELIVSDTYRRKGIGRQLMIEAEEKAKELGAHIMYLTTAKDWEERKFYEKIGYVKSADLINHYLGIDFINLTKVLK